MMLQGPPSPHTVFWASFLPVAWRGGGRQQGWEAYRGIWEGGGGNVVALQEAVGAPSGGSMLLRRVPRRFPADVVQEEGMCWKKDVVRAPAEDPESPSSPQGEESSPGSSARPFIPAQLRGGRFLGRGALPLRPVGTRPPP